MSHRSWRDIARPIIAEVLHAHQGAEEAVIRKALRDAYPFGPRAMHPYRIWCDEVQRQRGQKPQTPADRKRRAREAEQAIGSLFGAEEAA